jgi:hypothetical protein
LTPRVREFVSQQNRACTPVTSASISAHVQGADGDAIPNRTMRHFLRRMVFSHLRGKKRNILAEKAGSVSLRAEYLRRKLANRQDEAQRLPGKPEVFLDESYCNVHHVTDKTWLPADNVRFSHSGKGERYILYMLF